MRRRSIRWCLLLSVITLSFYSNLEAAPLLMNYQGSVSVNGEPFGSSMPQIGYFRFAIVDSENSWTNLYWSNDGNDPPTSEVAIEVVNGLFTAVLGDTTIPGMTEPLTATIFENEPLYFAVWFNDGTSGFSLLAPNPQLTSVGFAIQAQTAENALTLAGQNYSTTWPTTLANIQNACANNFHNIGGADAVDDTVSGTELDGVFSTLGLLRRTAAGTYSTITLGSGGGLDADLLDGQHAAAFMAAGTDNWVNTTGDTMTGTLNLPTNGLTVGGTQLIASGGRVGIGLSSPSTTLDVSGTAKMTGFQLGSSATAGQVLTADAAGVGTWQALPADVWSMNGETIYYPGPVSVGALKKVDGAFTVCGPKGALDQINTSGSANLYGNAPMWQSFTAGVSGTLIAVQLYVGGSDVEWWHGNLRIYEGEGSGGAILAEQVFQGYGGGYTYHTFVLEQPVELVASQLYTIFMDPYNDTRMNCRVHTGDPYSGGRCVYNATTDMVFKTYMLAAENLPGLNVDTVTQQASLFREGLAYPLQIGTDATNGNGAYLTIGGVWTNGSDRNAKTDFTAVDPREVLAKLEQLPVSTWRYKGEPEQIRHLGPVAQDFYQAFGLGDSDTHIGTLDAEGVALAAIKGLKLELDRKDARIEELENRLTKLETLLNR